jgi:hypothetical protein
VGVSSTVLQVPVVSSIAGRCSVLYADVRKSSEVGRNIYGFVRMESVSCLHVTSRLGYRMSRGSWLCLNLVTNCMSRTTERIMSLSVSAPPIIPSPPYLACGALNKLEF